MALNKSKGNDEAGTPVMSEICKTSLKKRIAEGYNPDIGLEDEMGQSGMTETSSHSVTECNTDAKSWIAEICAESRRLASHGGDRDNLHFLPELLPHLIRMCSYLPKWTGVMVQYFAGSTATGSSAHVEAEFKNLKRGLFKHENLPIRLDRFIRTHLGYIEGQMRLSSAALSVNSKDTEPNQMDTPPVYCDEGEAEDNHMENWRGLAVPPKKRKSYLTPCPEWLHVDTAPKKQKIQIGLLPNGNLTKPIKVDKAQVRLSNTCAFDSFCQCLCCAFCDREHFRIYIRSHQENTEIFNLVTSLVTKGINHDAYRQRAKILLNIFSYKVLKSGAKQVDSECNTAHIITRLMNHAPSLVTEIQCSNSDCIRGLSFRRPVPLAPVAGGILEREGIQGLQAALVEGVELQPSMCLRPLKKTKATEPSMAVDPSMLESPCNGEVNHSYSTGAALWVEIAAECTYRLQDFPMHITIGNEQFLLRGIVAFIPGPYREAMGHYVAYCRRTFSAWERYDDLSKGVSTAPEKQNVLCSTQKSSKNIPCSGSGSTRDALFYVQGICDLMPLSDTFVD